MYSPPLALFQLITWVWGVVFVLAACSPPQTAILPYVDLAVRTPLPTAAPAEIAPLRVAVAAIISPKGTAESYGALAEYLGKALGRPVELVQRRTYAEVNHLVADAAVDLAFVCTSAYVAGSQREEMQLLVAPQIDGGTVYFSEVIVPSASKATHVGDLRDKTFAFTDPMSFTGRVYPTYLVSQLGEKPDTFFRDIFFTYSHDRAIQAVAMGLADGAAVDSLVLDYALQRDPSLTDRIRVIHRSRPFGIPPVVVPTTLSLRQKANLEQLLLSMHEDTEGSRILGDLGIERFVRVDGALYDEVRQLIGQVRESNDLSSD